MLLPRACGMAVVLYLLTFTTAYAASKPDKKNKKIGLSKAEQFIRDTNDKLDQLYVLADNDRDLATALERALFDAGDLVERAERIKTNEKDLRLRSLATALLARIKRQVEKKPLQALFLTAGQVLAGKTFKAWKAACAQARDAGTVKWKEACRKARQERAPQPAKPESIIAPLPEMNTWEVNDKNLACALEMGKDLLALGKRQAGLAVFRFIGGKHTDDIPAILCAEAAGDGLMHPGFYQQAVELYRYGLKTCNRCINYLRMDNAKEIRDIAARIRYKLSGAQALADIEAYGPGYCAYRKGQELRITQKEFLGAYLAYAEVKANFPHTVFSSAADAYQVKCLLSLSLQQEAAKAKAYIAGQEQAYQAMARKLKTAEKQKPLRKNKALRRELRGKLAEMLTRLKRLQSIPLGRRAARTAQNMGRSLLKDKFSLYRGEVLVDLANYFFEQKLKPEQAQSRFMQAWDWLQEIEAADRTAQKTVAALTVPDKAKQVSSPPLKEAKIDRMGNIVNEKIDPGMIVNRLTSSWYLDDLREKCSLALGFLAFAKNNNKTATEWYAKVPGYDLATRLLERRGEWSNYTRLKWGAKHGYLNAFPEELKVYKKRLRFVVLMADFYFCTQRFAKAAEIAGRMLAGEFGKLSPEQDDYPQYLIASCKYWQGDRRKAYQACIKLVDKDSRNWSLTQHRAAFTAANLSWYIPDKEIMSDGLDLLRQLAASKKKTPYVYRARLVLGLRLMRLGDLKGGLRLLGKIPQKASGFYRIAEKYLKAYKQLKRAAKNNKGKRIGKEG